MAFMAPALAGETDTPRRHSLIHRPVAPVSPVVAHPESSVPPSQPIAAVTPSVTPPSSLALHHKLMKKPGASAAVAPLVSESTPAPKTSSRLSSAGNLPATLPPTVSDGISKSLPAPVSDRPIIPIATTPLSMSSLGAIATPAASRSLAAAAPSTAAASSGPTSANLSPSMARLMQMAPGFAALLQPSTPIVTPVVTPPSSTPPSAAPPSSPPPVSSTGTVTLSWSANSESDLAGYKIYYGTSSGEYTASGSPTVIGKVTGYTVTGLQRNTTYFFALSAYDSAGNESALSAEVSRSIL
jgi:Fibronectin type III domain